MSKSIYTLVQDIENLIDGNHSVSEEDIEKFGKELATVIARRLFAKRETSTDLRMSALGTTCDRKLWYATSTDHAPEELPPSAKMKFLFGDILEELLLFLAEQAGHEVRGRQDTLEIEGIQGHRDAIIDNVVIDVKSASSYSFNKFKRHELEDDDPFGYIDQVNAYHWATIRDDSLVDKDRFGFLVIDKQLGHIHLDMYAPNGKNYDELVRRKKAVVSTDSPPRRGYNDEPDGGSGNRKLGTVCGYCNYKFSCWPTVRTFLYSTGPRYLTEVKLLPKVPEATSKDGETF